MPKTIEFRDWIGSKTIIGYDPRDPDCKICGGFGAVPFAPRAKSFAPHKYGRCLCVNPFHIVARSSGAVAVARGWEKKSLFSEIDNARPALER